MTREESDPPLGPVLWGIARPTLAWTLHFIFVYAALSAACADRAVTNYGTAFVAIIIATVVALGAAGLGLFSRSRSPFHSAARWTTVIALLAILFNLAPVLLLTDCR